MASDPQLGPEGDKTDSIYDAYWQKVEEERNEERRRLMHEELDFETDQTADQTEKRYQRQSLETNSRLMEEMRIGFANGKKWAFFVALDKCAEATLPMPQWVADRCRQAIDAVWTGRVRSWDEFFGQPWPKSTNMPALRRNIELTDSVILFVERLHRGKYDNQRKPIDDSLFELVGGTLASAKR